MMEYAMGEVVKLSSMAARSSRHAPTLVAATVRRLRSAIAEWPRSAHPAIDLALWPDSQIDFAIRRCCSMPITWSETGTGHENTLAIAAISINGTVRQSLEGE